MRSDTILHKHVEVDSQNQFIIREVIVHGSYKDIVRSLHHPSDVGDPQQLRVTYLRR